MFVEKFNTDTEYNIIDIYGMFEHKARYIGILRKTLFSTNDPERLILMKLSEKRSSDYTYVICKPDFILDSYKHSLKIILQAVVYVKSESDIVDSLNRHYSRNPDYEIMEKK